MTKTELLPVTLTPAEVSTMADELSLKVLELDTAREEKKQANALFKERTDALESRISTLAKAVSDNEELRMVETEDRRNEEGGTIETWRLDTGEMVRSREMFPVEKTKPMFD